MAGRAPGGAPTYPASFAAVYAGQLGRAKAARVPMFFAATLQSLGILLLLRGVVDSTNDVTKQSVVAGCTVLVVAFVALNLLAQRFGALRAGGGLDYYGALPVRPSAVVLATASAWATLTVPGCVVTALVGVAVYQLPFANLWLLVPVIIAAGVPLAGLGAVLGLAIPRAELATVAGQLGMVVVLFLGVIPAANMPVALRGVRDVVPGIWAVDALADAFHPAPEWAGIGLDFAVSAGMAVVLLAASTWAFRRAVRAG